MSHPAFSTILARPKRLLTAGCLLTGMALSLAAPLTTRAADEPAIQLPPLPVGKYSLSVGDASVLEGNLGTRQMEFTVTLRRPLISPPAGDVFVQFETQDSPGIGVATAGSDYVATDGHLIFKASPALTQTKKVSVTVNSDVANEINEVFKLRLFNQTVNATIADDEANGVIVDDDPKPEMRIQDTSIFEGFGGPRIVNVLVKLSAPVGEDVSVNFATAPGTAQDGSDFAATQGALTIPAGETEGAIQVTVFGDTQPEKPETFIVNLSGAVNATIVDPTAVVTILDGDVP
jgi:hypothetical protein